MRTDNPITTMTGFIASAAIAGVGVLADTPLRRRLH